MNFYLWRDGAEEGPFSLEHLRVMFQDGRIGDGTLFRHKGDEKFQPIDGMFTENKSVNHDRFAGVAAAALSVGALIYFGVRYGGEGIVMIVAWCVGLVIYFIPTAVAKGHRHRDAIFALNLLLGWTFIGWVVALVWALAREERK